MKTDPEDYSITILHIIWNYSPNDRAAHPDNVTKTNFVIYEGRTESHEQQFFSCELGTADEGE